MLTEFILTPITEILQINDETMQLLEHRLLELAPWVLSLSHFISERQLRHSFEPELSRYPVHGNLKDIADSLIFLQLHGLAAILTLSVVTAS